MRAEYFRATKLVDTIMQLTRFVNPEWLVEFEANAVASLPKEGGSEPAKEFMPLPFRF